MGATVFEIEHNGLFYEFEFDSDHKWTHHTKWPDGKKSYVLLQGAGINLENAKKDVNNILLLGMTIHKAFMLTINMSI